MCGFWVSFSSLSELRTEYGHALQIPGQAHQIPFSAHLVQTAQGELAETQHRLDDSEHRLDGLLAQGVEGSASFGFWEGGVILNETVWA